MCAVVIGHNIQTTYGSIILKWYSSDFYFQCILGLYSPFVSCVITSKYFLNAVKDNKYLHVWHRFVLIDQSCVYDVMIMMSLDAQNIISIRFTKPWWIGSYEHTAIRGILIIILSRNLVSIFKIFGSYLKWCKM